MNKLSNFRSLAIGLLMISTFAISCNSVKNNEPKLIFCEDFNMPNVNSALWDTISRGGAHWNRYMVKSPDLVYIQDGNLVLKGRAKEPTLEDTTLYETGGLMSAGKFNFKYGRIDIRARLDEAQGAWPALWLLPDGGVQWPNGGEIDIMEHLNFDEFVYQTTHTNYTYVLEKKDPINGATAKINRGEYNVYSLEKTIDKLAWFVNDSLTFEYRKTTDSLALSEGQWPFDGAPFYIVLSQQLGGEGTWVGEINNENLPVEMWIDYIHVYSTEK